MGLGGSAWRGCLGAVFLIAINQLRFVFLFPLAFLLTLFFLTLSMGKTQPHRECASLRDVKPPMPGWKSTSAEAIHGDEPVQVLNIERAPSSPSLSRPLWAQAQTRINAVPGGRLPDSCPCLETLICTCRPLVLIEP